MTRRQVGALILGLTLFAGVGLATAGASPDVQLFAQAGEPVTLEHIHEMLHAAGFNDPIVTTTTVATTTTTVPITTTLAPTTTTTQPPPTTTTVAPTTTTLPPTTTTTAPSGSYGMSGTGPGLEPCTTTGIAVTTSAAVTSAPQNSVILMRAGTYSTGFTVPQGSTVKPYNCETVQINDNVAVNNNTTVAGLSITANSDSWALRITARTNVTVRNSNIRGGTIEAIRIDGAANGVTITGNLIDGGLNNHTMKVRSNVGNPTNITISNNLFTKIHFGGGEDLLQLEEHGVVVVDHNTFRDNPTGEDGIDVKSGGGVTITGNLFDGATINFECLLVQGNLQPILVQANKITGCTASLGAHPEGNHNPSWTFRQNLLVDVTLRLRRSFDARMEGNTWQSGGLVQLGTSTSGDYPRSALFTGNNFGSAGWDPEPLATFTCDGTNTGTGAAASACA